MPEIQPGNPFGAVTRGMVVDVLMLTFDGRQQPTPAQVEEAVDGYLAGPFAGLRTERTVIVDEILARIQVRIGMATTLDDPNGHIEWFHEVDRTDWRLWPRLDDYLRRADCFPPAVLHELDQSTDLTLQRLESPHRDGRWDRRGLVVGHVQSGKTTHYTGLMAKALDAGYHIVIVLAGVHNSLRSQTHERIDKYLIGRDSFALLEAVRTGTVDAVTGLIGVGADDHRLGKPPLPITILTCTTSGDQGDFKTAIANQVWFQVSQGSRLVMVVKKNAVILRTLIRWLKTQNASQGRIAAPALVIDDEADHASVNTGHPDDDPTTINRLIRELLMSFDRVGFVGYTATPFANIFIPHSVVHDRYGADLFPKSFIVNLKAPSDYIGPSLVFGHPGDESIGIPEQLPLPMHVPVEDAATWIPDKHPKRHQPGPIPASLREAIRLFVMVCAARASRGDEDVHNSMLVHATRFINVQSRVAQQIEDEIAALRNVIGSGGPESLQKLKDDCEAVWFERMVEPHGRFQATLGDRCRPLPSWTELWSRIQPALDRIEVMKINGESTDVLTYTRNPQGVYVIAVGGDKLSRGLTLEGLSVSYFLRTSRMFDTLMQMGRWFGYRPRYADLCRVYTTPFLYNAFQQIALAMEDLRADFDYMAKAQKDPETFGLRVRTPSDGLLITAANKIRHGQPVDVRFAETLVQALEIQRTGIQADRNWSAVTRLLTGLGTPQRSVRGGPTSHFLWPSVSPAQILEFLEAYEALSTPCFFDHCDPLRRYIREQLVLGELTDWTVTVISKRPAVGVNNVTIGHLSIPLVKRTDKAIGTDRFRTQAVVGSADEAVDLTLEEYSKALRESIDPANPHQIPSTPDREEVRIARPETRGLMLLYLIQDPAPPEALKRVIPSVAISFPRSFVAKPLTYTVNEVWREQYGLVGDMNEDDQSA